MTPVTSPAEIRSSLVYERLMNVDVRRRVFADRVDRLDRFAVLEGNAFQQQRDLFGAVDVQPCFLGYHDQLGCQTQEGWSRHAVARARSTVSSMLLPSSHSLRSPPRLRHLLSASCSTRLQCGVAKLC
jgi:hypothetical protein